MNAETEAGREGKPLQTTVGGGPCPHCQALEARIAELEQSIAAAQAQNATGEENRGAGEGSLGPPALPPLNFQALRVVAPEGWGEGWALRPSPQRRQWMNENPHSYHCLPLVMANQWGWQVLCPTDVEATWDGTAGTAGVRLAFDLRYASAIKSQFGSGIVTFSPPWLFRTSPGWDLYVKGPSNRWKTNCVPLEGVVETWWLNYTFTINWKLVAPGTVYFAKGESLAQLVPVPHGTFDNSRASEAPIEFADPKAAEELLRWRAERRRIADAPVNLHRFYRKAEGVEEHLQHVPVPPVLAAEIEAQDGEPSPRPLTDSPGQ